MSPYLEKISNLIDTITLRDVHQGGGAGATEGPAGWLVMELDVTTAQRVGKARPESRKKARPASGHHRDIELVTAPWSVTVFGPHDPVDFLVRRQVRPTRTANEPGLGGIGRVEEVRSDAGPMNVHGLRRAGDGDAV